ncbi:MAG: peroxide stress protein YaaA [Alphaproteobacteria bacterium]|nr:peroxide stress protein YaaA [Alphaproteobacteria bacterium]
MLVLLSPSKTQDFSASSKIAFPTQPVLLDESVRLVKELKGLSSAEIGKLMHISEKLADLNHGRFKEFTTPFTTDNAKPAALAFKGDVYDGLDADSLSLEALEFSQHSLRILSGLYGVLRPKDLIQAYRLEMKTPLKNPRGKDLYDFWGERITDVLNAHLKQEQTEYVINLASQEYFKAIKPKKLQGRLITVHFKERKDGALKVVAIFAKRARGMMARHIVENSIRNLDGITRFTQDGYSFDPEASNDEEFVFARDSTKG